jgi:small subunit ribosomal protein S1
MEQETLEEILSDNDIEESQDKELLNKLYDESLSHVQEGKIVQGEVVEIGRDWALIDIGYKSTGQVPISEFLDPNGHPDVDVGDKLDVLLLRREDQHGRPVLSRSKVEEKRTVDRIEEIYNNNGTVSGKFISKIKGGFLVDIGLRAFLPGSQVDIRSATDKESWIGTEHEFKILKFDRQKRNVVLSRRRHLEEELRREACRHFKEGEIYGGTVTSIVDFGLFVDLGGIEGLVHNSNISWEKGENAAKLYQVGDQVTVKVLVIAEETLRMSLGIKQLEPNPWETIDDKYPIGAVIEGKIKNIKSFGLFIGIDEGIDGLIHISNIFWTNTVRHPKEVYKKGEFVQAVVLEIDKGNERFSLGIKQLTPDPWEHISEKYRPGTYVVGKIVRTNEMGLIVEVEKAVEGVIKPSRLQTPEHLSKYISGDLVQTKVTGVSRKAKRIELMIPQKDGKKIEKDSIEDKSLASQLQKAMRLSSHEETKESDTFHNGEFHDEESSRHTRM